MDVNPTTMLPDDAQAARSVLERIGQRAERHVVERDGCRVCWRRFGEGRPLVLIHGGHGSWMHWIRNIEALAQHFAVWVPDLPGYGDSDAPRESSLSGVLDPMRASLDAVLGVGTPVDLVGFSFGGLVAANLAGQRPEVGRLALLGPVGHSGRRRPRGELKSWRRALLEEDFVGLSTVMGDNLRAHMLHDESSVDALALKVHTDSCLRTRFHSRPISRSGGLPAALDRHSGPLLLVWGEHDVTAEPEAAALALSAGREDCRTHIVPDAGHWVQYEQAAHINRLLVDWLGEQDAGDRR